MPIYKAEGKKDGLQKYRVIINFTDAQGKPRKKERTAYGSAAAKDTEQALLLEIKQAKAPSNMRFSDLYAEYKQIIENEVRPTTAYKKFARFNNNLLPYFGHYSLQKITARHIQAWKLSVESAKTAAGTPYKHNTKKDLFKELSAIFNYAVRMEYIAKNPCRITGNFKEPESMPQSTVLHYYTADQFKAFITEAKNTAQTLRDWDFYVFFSIAFYTGMRKGEINALRWTDIQGDFISITKAVTQKLRAGDVEGPPKTKSSVRTLQIPTPLKEILSAHKTRQKAISSFTESFYVCGGIRCLRDSSISNRNFQYAAAANLPHIKIHDFRHSHASLLANAGINIQEIARRLGHSDVKMTWNTYAHLYPKEEERAVEILNHLNF